MEKRKKENIEFRFYEIPQNEYILALLGDSWIRDYGYYDKTQHFHNLMEIGYCIYGAGKLELDQQSLPFESGMASIIPENFPHRTISDREQGPAYWEYLFLDPMKVLREMYPGDSTRQKKLLAVMNRKASFFCEKEHPELVQIVKLIMEEKRSEGSHHRTMVRGLAMALVAGILRMYENGGQKDLENSRKEDLIRISNALEYIRMEYARNIRVEDLAAVCHMSETHFRRVFESSMNMPPVDYVNLVRVQAACELMRKTDDSMLTVAQRVGFTTTSTFNRNFKKFLGTSPYRWKIDPANYPGKLQEYKISVRKGW